ncbi:MAG: linear amide C-N hydrolase [Anaerolineales bacterium]|nr:linear amide C-N hydrolase [Anaerolineales bacterium]
MNQVALQHPLRRLISLTCMLCILAGCTYPTSISTLVPDAQQSSPASTESLEQDIQGDILSDSEIATLSSLEKIDDYPLYTMHFSGSYSLVSLPQYVTWRAFPEAALDNSWAASSPWACSLFAALGDQGNMYFGRNFDWEYSPALLLFTDPPDGYASVSMVDIAYFGFTGNEAVTVTDLPLAERQALLDAPFMPFDGMNEQGLVIGMAAVPPGNMIPDPGKTTLGSLQVIRLILDRAANVQEAIDIFHSYNVVMRGGPPLHYLIADSHGQAVLVEFHQGEIVVIPNQAPWHQATNFLRASVGESTEGVCWRYDRIQQRLTESNGKLDSVEALELLRDVAQEGTQWSVVYGISGGDVSVAMGRAFGETHTFRLMTSTD